MPITFALKMYCPIDRDKLQLIPPSAHEVRPMIICARLAHATSSQLVRLSLRHLSPRSASHIMIAMGGGYGA
jgi:hypothetical protein